MEGGICVYIEASAFHGNAYRYCWHNCNLQRQSAQRKTTACGLLTSCGRTADCGVGVAGIHWPAELRVSHGLLSSTQRVDYCSVFIPTAVSWKFTWKREGPGSSRDYFVTPAYWCGTVPNTLSSTVTSFGINKNFCYLVDSVVLGPTQPSVQWVPCSFLGVKRQGRDDDHTPHLS